MGTEDDRMCTGPRRGFWQVVRASLCYLVLRIVVHRLSKEDLMPSREQESSSILSVRLPDELIQRLDRYLD